MAPLVRNARLDGLKQAGLAPTIGRHPYNELFDEILMLAKRGKGWTVPVPAVGLSPDGAVVLRWLTSEHELEIAYRALHAGEYSVRRRGAGDAGVLEGSLGTLDPLKDLVDKFVFRRLQQRPWR